MGEPKSSSSDLRFGRRRVFHALTRELRTAVEELRGVRHFRLDQLADCSDERLATVVPTWRSHGPVRVVDNRLVKCEADGSVSSVLFELSESQRRLLVLFDGVRSLACIGQDWAVETGLPRQDAFAQAKRLWLPLAELGILVPQPSFVPDR
jgi:hypothetical protein